MNFTLRPWRAEDAASLAQAANDPAVASNLRDVFPCPYTLADAQDRKSTRLNSSHMA